MRELPPVLTQDQYINELEAFITEEMVVLPEGKKHLSFWIDFNRSKKVEFDEYLRANNIVVE